MGDEEAPAQVEPTVSESQEPAPLPEAQSSKSDAAQTAKEPSLQAVPEPEAHPVDEETSKEVNAEIKEETQSAVEIAEADKTPQVIAAVPSKDQKSSSRIEMGFSESSMRATSLSKSLLSRDDFTRRSLSSKGKIALGSVISIRRSSIGGDVYDKSKVPRYANTYKLNSENAFNAEKVVKILESVVIEALENLTYEPDKCAKQAKWASSAIRAQVKDLKFDRYKLVCLMTIGEKNSQDVLATCRFLWDIERDSYAVFAHENSYVFGFAQCFGLYYE